MECLQQCLGSNVWVIAGVIGGWYVVATGIDFVPETAKWGVFPIGRFAHLLAGNLRRALRKAPGGGLLPAEDPKP
jgi:hypothetical protein